MLKKIFLAGAALVTTVALAVGAGYFPGWPVVGGNSTSQCVNNVNGACVQYAPAGPSVLNGNEMIPADTGLSSGQNPQTVLIPASLLAGGQNRLIGGDFTTNLWQRGTTPLSNALPASAEMTADRWWVISPTGTVDVLKTTPSATAADYLGNLGFYNGLEVRRHTGTNTAGLTCIGQTLDSKQAAPLVGNNAVLSFYGYAPSTYTATSSNITVSIAYYTAADAAAATQGTLQYTGPNSQAAASSTAALAGGITGYTAAIGGISVGGGTVSSGVATISLSATPTRYAVYAPIPATNSAGTAITGVNVGICGAFEGATAVTTDFFELFAVQLEAKSGTASANLPNGVTSPSGFDKRLASLEAAYQYYYSYVLNESTSNYFAATCGDSTASVANCNLPFPVAMRLPPSVKYTTGFSAFTTTAMSALAPCSAAALATASIGTSTPSVSNVMVICTASVVPAAGSVNFLVNNGTTGVISASAEP